MKYRGIFRCPAAGSHRRLGTRLARDLRIIDATIGDLLKHQCMAALLHQEIQIQFGLQQVMCRSSTRPSSWTNLDGKKNFWTYGTNLCHWYRSTKSTLISSVSDRYSCAACLGSIANWAWARRHWTCTDTKCNSCKTPSVSICSTWFPKFLGLQHV